MDNDNEANNPNYQLLRSRDSFGKFISTSDLRQMINSTELIVTKHETSVRSRPHSQFHPCVTHLYHHHHHHPTVSSEFVNQWRCWSDSSLVTLVVVVVVVIITTDDDDKAWQSRDCKGKTSTRREQLLFCANLSRTWSRPGLAWSGLPDRVRKSSELS